MKKILILIFISISNSVLVFGQTVLLNEGTTVNNTVSGTWGGVDIPRNVPTQFTFRNNSITSINSAGYMLQAGDESPLSSNNNLDGEVITGNKFDWTGTYGDAVITHGLLVGYNINQIVKYNYLNNVPYGIIFKSGTDAGVNMTNSTGVCAYNIVRNGKFAGRAKGINNVKFYNNTFYSGDGHGWYLLLISTNMDRIVPAGSENTKVFNNIFYSTIQIPMIEIYDNASLSGFQSDYNVFYCTAGEPTFNIAGVIKTWTQWRALGYDTHSIIVNPDFINTIDFVPRVRLDYGTNLGAEVQTGLSTTATWIAGVTPSTANQNGKWQVGARIYYSSVEIPVYSSSSVENATPTILDITFSLSLSNIIPSTSAFIVKVNSVSRSIKSVAIVSGKVRLNLDGTINYGDVITISYTKPGTNQLQTTSGGIVDNITDKPVINNVISQVKDAQVTIKMTIAPNHVHKILNTHLEYSGSVSNPVSVLSSETIRIYDLSGKLFLEKLLVSGVTDLKIPLNLDSGIYTISLSANGLEMATQKIIAY